MPDADFVAVQAFGRNSYRDNELPVIHQHHQGAPDDVYGMFLWLQAQNFDPGRSNIRLGQETMAYASQLHIPVAAQWEIAYSIWLLNRNRYTAFDHQVGIYPIWPLNKAGFNTREVKEKITELMKQHGWRRPLLVSHCYMLSRDYLMSLKLGWDPIVPLLNTTAFDPRSIQSQCRGPREWWWREIPGRVYMALRGWV